MLCVLALSSAIALSPANADDVETTLGVLKPTRGQDARRLDLARDLTNKLVRPDGKGFKPARLESAGKMDYFLVYFGAHWCPNSKKFTPKLTQFYREQRGAHRNFEVIFVSADKDQEAMLDYMTGYKMPWPAVRFAEHKGIASIRSLAGRGYPCVALVNAKGELLAHSYGEGGKGNYVGPLKPMEKLQEILDQAEPRSVARSGR